MPSTCRNRCNGQWMKIQENYVAQCENPKNVWRNYQLKAAVKRKEDAWKGVLRARNKDARERCLGVHKEEKRKIKRCIHQSKKEVQEQLGRKMNQNVIGNRKLSWKEVSKENGGKVEKSGRGRSTKDLEGVLR